jgi:tetraacyldisaccharide 4'-kinase
MAPASWLYGWGMRRRDRAYARGFLETVRLPAPVFCLGNLAVGGSGKTPGVLWLARRLRERGHRPAVVTRGYGGSFRGVTVVSRGDGAALPEARAVGDEPRLIAERLPEVPVVASSDRASAGEWALTELGADCLVMDDGFQHRRLHRDRDLLCFDAGDAAEAFLRGRRALLPAGRWREPLSAAARAHVIFLTKVETQPENVVAAVVNDMARRRPNTPVVPVRSVLRLWRPATQQEEPLEVLRGRRVAVLSGLARPERFEGALASAGVRVEVHVRERDHHFFTSAECRRFRRRAGDRPVIVTEKDAQRLPPDFPDGVVRLDWSVEEGVWTKVLDSVFG